MNELLFEREKGTLSSASVIRVVTHKSLHSLQLYPWINFDGGERAPVIQAPGSSRQQTVDETYINDEPTEVFVTKKKDREAIWAHQAGVTALDVEGYGHRLMITGGSDATIKGWRLSDISPSSSPQTITSPISVPLSDDSHNFGITSLAFHPLDSTSFFTSSYDHTLKLHDVTSFTTYGSVSLSSIIYSFAIQPHGAGNLIACCTQHPLVRLVDLHTGNATMSLAGHSGAVIAAAWSPRSEYILLTGGADGTVRVWDVRTASRTLRLLDLENSVGVLGTDGQGAGYEPKPHAKAHRAAVNGLTFTDDGRYIVTAGHDNAVRVWSADTGANTLAHFGPTIVNTKLSHKPLLASPVSQTRPGYQILVLPNESHIVIAELFEGRILRRLKLPGPSEAVLRNRPGAQRKVGKRVTSLAWRGPGDGFVSGDTGGCLRVWGSGGDEDVVDEEGVLVIEPEEGRKRKRNVLDEVYKDLVGKKVTFG